MLLIDSHPVMPTNAAVRAAIDTLAANLGKTGVKVQRESALLPDFTVASRLYMRILLSLLASTFPRISLPARALPRRNCRPRT